MTKSVSLGFAHLFAEKLRFSVTPPSSCGYAAEALPRRAGGIAARFWIASRKSIAYPHIERQSRRQLRDHKRI
ncbi:MAG TPA: hypothetical protein VK612_01415 [Pyrinomonadaceae bacterium]|nr:hypothetical protein [Pyrinomonadaceae bacterium]